MKKLQLNPMVRVTMVFCIFLLGIFMGRNSYASPVQSAGFNIPDKLIVSEAKEKSDPKFSNLKPVNINTATLEQLQTLPGIGPVLAQRIIDHREANGPFPSAAHLIQVDGIGEKTLDTIMDYISVQEDAE